jgi:hypothetical protein
MSTKRTIAFDPSVRPIYSHLEPIVNLLLAHGNRSAHDYVWGENRTGPFCHLREALNFDLIERSFEIPSFIRLLKDGNSIECDASWATIVGGWHGPGPD